MRAHHCFSCNSCIAKQDHHSVWINGCIGDLPSSTLYLFILTTKTKVVELWLCDGTSIVLLVNTCEMTDQVAFITNYLYSYINQLALCYVEILN